jgi:hypothetical protein
VRLRIIADDTDRFENGCRVCFIAPSDAAKLGSDGSLIELVNDVGAPLRAWTQAFAAIQPNTISLGPIARSIVRLADGDWVELRALQKPNFVNGATKSGAVPKMNE